MPDNRTAGAETKTAPEADANGTPEQQTQAASADEARQEAMQRAEELVDRIGEQVGHYVSVFGHNILKWAARAREEAEDIWAEAQAIRDQQRNKKD
jgi:hypothetical protein